MSKESVNYEASFENLWNIKSAQNLSEVPILLKGRPGIGKTAMVEWLGSNLGRNVITNVVADSDPCDISGVWTISEDNKTAVRVPPAKMVHDKPVIIFLDEFTAGSPEQMAAAAKLTDGSRLIGDYKIHPESIIVAAINPDNAIGAASKLAAPLLSRFRHIDVGPDQAVSWMCAQEGILGIVGAWLTQSPDSAIDSDDIIADCVDKIKPFACPRTWTRAAIQYPNPSQFERWFEFVGASAAKFIDFYDGYSANVPSPEDILDKGSKSVPDRGDLVHVCGVAAASRVSTPDQGVNMMRWIKAAAEAGKIGAVRVAAATCRDQMKQFKEYSDLDWEPNVLIHELFSEMIG